MNSIDELIEWAYKEKEESAQHKGKFDPGLYNIARAEAFGEFISKLKQLHPKQIEFWELKKNSL